VEEVLEHHDILAVTEFEGEGFQLLGKAHPVQRTCWDAVLRAGRASPAEVAEAAGMVPAAATAVLGGLAARRVVIAYRDGSFCSLPHFLQERDDPRPPPGRTLHARRARGRPAARAERAGEHPHRADLHLLRGPGRRGGAALLALRQRPQQRGRGDQGGGAGGRGGLRGRGERHGRHGVRAAGLRSRGRPRARRRGAVRGHAQPAGARAVASRRRIHLRGLLRGRMAERPPPEHPRGAGGDRLQPAAAGDRPAPAGGRGARGGGRVRGGLHLRDPGERAAPGERRGPGGAQRHQVPGRAQRPDGRRGAGRPGAGGRGPGAG
jgi:translation initiation factor IF-2